MIKLDSVLPQDSETVTAIYTYHKQKGDSEEPRTYLGASIIGHPCSRYLWYCFRHCCQGDFSGRMYRLFETGNLEEYRMAAELVSIGCEVHVQDEHGNQFSVQDIAGHFGSHLDGWALGIPEAPKTEHILEFKTHNRKSFDKLVVEGVQKSKPQHYCQMQVYMHLTGMKRALYLARNKDTDELYSERVHYNKEDALALMARALMIITSQEPPQGISDRSDYWECRYCDANKICHGGKPDDPVLALPSVSCRQCCHATPKLDGIARWQCELKGKSLSKQEQDRACDRHLVLPFLMNFEVSNHGADENGHFIEFCDDSGKGKMEHGYGFFRFSTDELTKMHNGAVCNDMIQTAKEMFGGTVKACGIDLLDEYPLSDPNVKSPWKGSADLLEGAWKDHFRGMQIRRDQTYEESHTVDIMKLTPTRKTVFPDYVVVEFFGNAIAIEYENGTAEIRVRDES